MIDLKSQLDGVRDRERWAARGASFVSKVKATRMVWFPPSIPEGGKAATKATATRSTGAARKATKRTARTVTGGTRKKAAAK
jgi:hypothetical protein